MKDVKTKPEGGKPKLLENAAKAPKIAVKDLWLKSKEKSISELRETPFAKQQEASSGAPANRAEDQLLSGAENVAGKGASVVYRGGKKLAQRTAQNAAGEKTGNAGGRRNPAHFLAAGFPAIHRFFWFP